MATTAKDANKIDLKPPVGDLLEAALIRLANGESDFSIYSTLSSAGIDDKQAAHEVARIKRAATARALAGTAKKRQSALNAAERMRASVPRKHAEIDQQIRALEAEKAAESRKLQDCEKRLQVMVDSARACREAAPPSIKRYAAQQRKALSPLKQQIGEGRRCLQQLDMLASTLHPGSFARSPESEWLFHNSNRQMIGSWADELGVECPLTIARTETKKGTAESAVVDPRDLAAFQQAATKRRAEIPTELERSEKRLADEQAAIDALLDHYLETDE
jgi:hypothetical protein